MFLSKLLSPKWKSEDPATRMRGVQRLSKPAVLNHIACFDPDPPVREMAKQRLEQLETGALKTLLALAPERSRTDMAAQMDRITSQAAISQLVKAARKMEVKMLAVGKCWDKAVLDEVIKDDGNLSTYALAIHQKWFLGECEKRGNCDPAELMRWLTAGRRVPLEYADEFARCTRGFRSVAVLDTKTKYESYGRMRSTTVSRSFNLEESEDHFYYDERQRSVAFEKMMWMAQSDRKKKGKPAKNIVVVEHKDWNKWIIELFPRKTVFHLDPLKPAFFERGSDTKARVIDWLPNHFAPLSWFLVFRDENEKEALDHFLKVKQRVCQS